VTKGRDRVGEAIDMMGEVPLIIILSTANNDYENMRKLDPCILFPCATPEANKFDFPMSKP
jgi:hypothetical protein